VCITREFYLKHPLEWNGMEWNRMEWNGMEWNVLYYSDNKIKYELLLNTGIYCN
jgi:hypothetical protein